MKDALERIVRDAYERGKLDAELHVHSDLSLFPRAAARQILGEQTTKLAAHYVPEGAIVELDDGRLGVFCPRHSRKGYALVKVSPELGVEVSANSTLVVWKYPQELAGQLVQALNLR